MTRTTTHLLLTLLEAASAYVCYWLDYHGHGPGWARAGLVLFAFTMAMNMLARRFVNKFREVDVQ